MSALRQAVDALVGIAEQAGLPAGRARQEALVFAAAIAESAPRAASDWAAAADGVPRELGALNAAFFDAASRGRDRVGLEVDADSPTGADGLYTSMGWGTKYVTESWHRDVTVT